MAEPADRGATRASYDVMAAPYAELFAGELDRAPLDRAMLGAFAETVGTDADVLEVGSGPGVVTAHLHALGVRVRGIDLSPAMVALARRARPGIAFDVGDMAALDVPDAGLGGLVAWYSIIHVPDLPATFAEFRRVLRPDGHLLLAFQVGDGHLHLDEAFGHRVSLDFRRLRPDDVTGLLEDAGFAVTARLVRSPDPASAAAPIPQCSLLATRCATAPRRRVTGPAPSAEFATGARPQGAATPR